MVKNYGIHDEWKDLNKVNDIDIKSVDGVIDSIKVNGEEAGGGGMFTTAKLTIVSENAGKVGTMMYGLMTPYYAYRAEAYAFGGGETEIPIILIEGQILLTTDEATLTIASTSGAITYDSEASMYIITGDCTITVA